MDDLGAIDNFEDLNLWLDKKIRIYNKVHDNIIIYKNIIFPNGMLNSFLEDKEDYGRLKKKIDEVKRNCKIIFRKIQFYNEMLESEEEFDILKEYCLEMQELHVKYAKTWKEIAGTIKSTVKYIQEKEKE